MAFPLVASIFSSEAFPKWLGYLDVVIAFALVIMTILIDVIARGKIESHVIQASYRLYRLLVGLPLALLIVFFIFGDHIDWSILLPGLAWRSWLLLYILPAGLTVWQVNRAARKQEA
jgi:hypothetical protein